jgi:hypothetical protein
MLTSYLDSPDNNDLILQLYPSYAAPIYQESSEEPPRNNYAEAEEDENMDNKEQKLEEKDELSALDEEIKERYSTEYVLEGSLNLDLEILDPADKKSAPESEKVEPESKKTEKKKQ